MRRRTTSDGSLQTASIPHGSAYFTMGFAAGSLSAAIWMVAGASVPFILLESSLVDPQLLKDAHKEEAATSSSRSSSNSNSSNADNRVDDGGRLCHFYCHALAGAAVGNSFTWILLHLLLIPSKPLSITHLLLVFPLLVGLWWERTMSHGPIQELQQRKQEGTNAESVILV
ncbi:expressed unknown protein [Seminavis robusta]|uniref:Uncharacterized protein n=1 Tax=Seminavis robusta TaxID=568900 RepID=A0A9N8HUY1_9STRA|nr:expressed unknown protein [Seminavis robusta]|eukprot:Sro2192_g318410.1 n/a (171) ;mRNA; f:4616-5212